MTEMPLDFSSVVSSKQRGDVLKPIVHRQLYNPSFKGFDVRVAAWQGRAYDGKFHPSTHSNWTVRQLLLYLLAPNLLTEEHMELTSVLAVTAGSFWHEFLQNLWLADGIMVRQRTDEEAARTGINPAEVKIWDPEVNVTGHADGELTTGEGVEIKTINDFQVHKIVDEPTLKAKKPGYWCQTQDYLAAKGWDAMRYFFLAPSYPYPNGEFVVRADKKYQAKRRDEYQLAMELAEKYRGVISAPADLIVAETDTCCAPRSKTAQSCPVRLACPIGRIAS